jgi:hypothetical protein
MVVPRGHPTHCKVPACPRRMSLPTTHAPTRRRECLGERRIACQYISPLSSRIPHAMRPALHGSSILTLEVQVTPKKVIRVKAVRVAINQTVKVALLAGLEKGHSVEGFQGHLEADAVPLLLDDLSTLASGGGERGTDNLEGGAPARACLSKVFALSGSYCTL